MRSQRKYTIAEAPRRNSRAWVNHDYTWEELLEKFKACKDTGETVEQYRAWKTAGDDRAATAKEAAGGFLGGALLESPGARTRENVKSRSLITIDIDGTVKEPVEPKGAYAWAIYTTHGHVEGTARYRLVVPLLYDVNPVQWDYLLERYCYEYACDCSMGECPGTLYDSSFKTISQFMYYPTRCADGDFEFLEGAGEPLDPTPYLKDFEVREARKKQERAKQEQAHAGKPDLDTLAQVSDALRYIPAHDYQRWIEICAALKDGGVPFEVFDAWSAGSGKYSGTEETRKKWESFHGQNGAGDRVGLGTVLYHAKAAGWKPQHKLEAAVVFAEPAAPEDALGAFLDKVRSKAYEPLPTGIHDIDHALCGGFFRQSIVLMGAAPGMGKTVMAQWLAERMAAAGAGVLYFVLEMSPEQMLARSLSRRIWKTTGRDLSALDIMQGYRWTDDQKKLVEDAIKAHKQELGERLRYVNQSAELDAIMATMDAEAARAKDAGAPVPLVVIDYLHLVRGKDREDDTATIKRAMKAFKDFAVQHDTMVLVITANSRSANQKGIAGLESGRDTSAIEYGADVHLGLEYTAIEEDRQNAEGKPYTPKQLEGMKKHAEREGRDIPSICREISLTVNKHRFGASGRRARLLFDGKHSVFDQVTTAEAFGDWKPITPELEAALSLPETPGECLRRLRNAKGFTPGVLGKKLGVSAAFVSGLEEGNRDADPEQREAIAAALGVEPSAIWK